MSNHINIVKELIETKIVSKYASYEDKKFVVNGVINGWLLQRKSIQVALILFKDFLLDKKDDLTLINDLMQRLIDLGYDKYMPGAAYYSWAVYFAANNNIDKSKEMLKTAVEKNFKDIDEKDIHPILLKNLGLDEIKATGLTDSYQSNPLDKDLEKHLKRYETMSKQYLINLVEEYSKLLNFNDEKKNEILDLINKRSRGFILHSIYCELYKHSKLKELLDLLKTLDNDGFSEDIKGGDEFYYQSIFHAKENNQQKTIELLQLAKDHYFNFKSIDSIDSSIISLLGKETVQKIFQKE